MWRLHVPTWPRFWCGCLRVWSSIDIRACSFTCTVAGWRRQRSGRSWVGQRSTCCSRCCSSGGASRACPYGLQAGKWSGAQVRDTAATTALLRMQLCLPHTHTAGMYCHIPTVWQTCCVWALLLGRRLGAGFGVFHCGGSCCVCLRMQPPCWVPSNTFVVGLAELTL